MSDEINSICIIKKGGKTKRYVKTITKIINFIFKTNTEIIVAIIIFYITVRWDFLHRHLRVPQAKL